MAGMILVVGACVYVVLAVLFGWFLKKKPSVNVFNSKDNSWLQAIYLAYVSERVNVFKSTDNSRSNQQQDKAQVFEVIVRQALAGAPWREICAGPMQVNNITPEEVEVEVQRRRQ